MKKKVCILLAVAVVGVLLTGCGGGEISNDVISVRDYKSLKVEKPTDEKDTEAVAEFETDLWNALLENCEVKELPQKELQELMAELETQYGYVADYSAEELIEEQHGMSLSEYAEHQLKKKYAIALIAEEEGLTLTSKEYEKELKKRASEGGIDDPQMYEDMFGREALEEMFLEERVLEFLTEHAK